MLKLISTITKIAAFVVVLFSALFFLIESEPETPYLCVCGAILLVSACLMAIGFSAGYSASVTAASEDVDFVVNDRGELGVRVGDQLLWFFRGRTRPFVYGYHSAGGDRMHWRRCTSTEFGDRIMVPGHVFGDRYTHGDGWQPMPTHKRLTTPVK